MNDSNISCKKKWKKEFTQKLLRTSFAGVIFFVLVHIARKPHDSDMELFIFIALFTFGYLVFLAICDLVLVWKSKHFKPKFRPGQFVIYNRYNYTTNLWDYDFSADHRIVSQVPHYSIVEVGECSFLLKEVGGTKFKEVKFCEQAVCLFTPEEFREKGRCC